VRVGEAVCGAVTEAGGGGARHDLVRVGEAVCGAVTAGVTVERSRWLLLVVQCVLQHEYE
jgi:hypothetical protein